MTQHCIEIVTYKIGNSTEADRQRDSARELACRLPGFGGWLPLSGSNDQSARADIVLWASSKSAEAAAEVVRSSSEFADFRATISEIGGMGHYASPTGGLALMQPEDGVEIGRFRLRPNVSEATLQAAHARMITHHLARQPGWRGQRLVRLQDGTFMDIAFAVTQAHSQVICNCWAGNADCEEFLSLIEPISMEFGEIA